LKLFFPLLLFIGLLSELSSYSHSSETYENKKVGHIVVSIENLSRGGSFDQKQVLHKLETKVGDPFSHTVFDRDLKSLSDQYAVVEPSLELVNNKVNITLKVWQKPTIRSITWKGNEKIRTSKLQSELDIKPHTLFNQEQFNRALNKVKEYYIKRGYFESQIDYALTPYEHSNELAIEIHVYEGHSGHISQIRFYGLSSKEQRAIFEFIQTKKHNFFTSWLTGRGHYHEEALEQDELVIVNYLQNAGYADARVSIQTKEDHAGRLEVYIHAVKGDRYSFGEINVEGNTIFDKEQIRQVMAVGDGDVFSPDQLRTAIQNIRDLYGKKGYIEVGVNYTLHLSQNAPIYDVNVKIEEGEQFHIGLIHITGNASVHKNVILRQSLLVPGAVFDSRLLKSTQMRLESLGYFKSVNVYAVKTPEDQKLGEGYRDVVIEVQETRNGSFNLFGGVNSSDSLFGGIDLAENNFNFRGLMKFWKEGISSLRGNGEYVHLRAQVGKKQQNYSLTWIDPYLNDTLWKFGFDTNYSSSRIQSQNYKVNSVGGSIFGNYALTNFWTFGLRWRLRNSIAHVDSNIQSKEAQQERQNSGLISGISSSLNYDTTDNPFKPHRGMRSYLELEFGGVRRHSKDPRSFPFGKVSFLNTYYHPIWKMGTLKLRGDVRFLCPLGQGSPETITISERFFLGGDTSVRGYKPFSIGPKFPKSDNEEASSSPSGGVSSLLLSAEYLQNISQVFDLFAFFDAGSISKKQFQMPKMRTSWGFGARIELGNRVPFIFGIGFPINPESRDDVKKFFFSMGAQF